MLLQPGDHLWLDAWIPRADPLWVMDVAVAAEWVGSWWSAALREAGVDGLTRPRGEVRAGAARRPGVLRGPWSRVRCSPAERKLVGLSQWRAREGALFSSCLYTRWDPDPWRRCWWRVRGGSWRVGRLPPRAVAVGVADLVPGSAGGMRALADSLLRSFDHCWRRARGRPSAAPLFGRRTRRLRPGLCRPALVPSP